MEEDAGKSLHEGFTGSDKFTYLDFNRSGVPLVEIVSAPDIRTSPEAHDYLTRLKQILEYLDVCDGNMEEGSLRCDANVSVRPAGDEKLGTRTELKNLNSFRYVQKAIDFEVQRQIDIIEGGGRVVQETRLWNSVEERTVSMRSKEEAHDYRYFPEPDLPLLTVDQETVRNIEGHMPELPDARRSRFVRQYALSEYDSAILATTRALADFFEETVRICKQPKTAANWIMGDLLRFYKDDAKVDMKDLSESRVSPKKLADLILLVEAGRISGKMAKAVFEEMYQTARHPDAIIQEKGLVQISDPSEIERVIDQVIAENAKTVEQYRAGKTGSFGFFVGQVMKQTGGRANPQTVNEILRKKLVG
jgi:aspartyl-tRNA(Asn)/glutamyl-tRNA(Gln) amidotransferase subunit B